MKPNAAITLNGKSHPLSLPMTVSGLLESLGMQEKPVVVELNEVAVFPRDFKITRIEEDSKVEIVVLAAGG